MGDGEEMLRNEKGGGGSAAGTLEAGDAFFTKNIDHIQHESLREPQSTQPLFCCRNESYFFAILS